MVTLDEHATAQGGAMKSQENLKTEDVVRELTVAEDCFVRARCGVADGADGDLHERNEIRYSVRFVGAGHDHRGPGHR